jgi:hypothetical protein
MRRTHKPRTDIFYTLAQMHDQNHDSSGRARANLTRYGVTLGVILHLRTQGTREVRGTDIVRILLGSDIAPSTKVVAKLRRSLGMKEGVPANGENFTAKPERPEVATWWASCMATANEAITKDKRVQRSAEAAKKTTKTDAIAGTPPGRATPNRTGRCKGEENIRTALAAAARVVGAEEPTTTDVKLLFDADGVVRTAELTMLTPSTRTLDLR